MKLFFCIVGIILYSIGKAFAKCKMTGSIFVMSADVTKRAELVHSHVECDGKTYKIPSRASQSIVLLDLKNEVEKGKLRVTPALTDAWQDMMIAQSEH